VTGCATPSSAHPSEGQLWIGPLPPASGGRAIRKSTARTRRRDERLRAEGRHGQADRAAVIETAEYILRTTHPHLPIPTGLEYPHRLGSSACDPEHPLWQSYDEALGEAQERASIELPPEAGDEEYQAHVLAQMLAHPAWPDWQRTEDQCARDALRRTARSRTERANTEAMERRRRGAAAGLDLSSAEYLDTLTPRGRAAWHRRAYKRGGGEFHLREARRIEREHRAKQRPAIRK
jgi:hypothetical protein